MIRHCNGKDMTLVREVPQQAKDFDLHKPPIYVPCACGALFEDKKCSVIYPHERI